MDGSSSGVRQQPQPSNEVAKERIHSLKQNPNSSSNIVVANDQLDLEIKNQNKSNDEVKTNETVIQTKTYHGGKWEERNVKNIGLVLLKEIRVELPL